MNPCLQSYWRDLHLTLFASIKTVLSNELPADLVAPIGECYRAGRYWLTDHTRLLKPPLPVEDVFE